MAPDMDSLLGLLTAAPSGVHWAVMEEVDPPCGRHPHRPLLDHINKASRIIPQHSPYVFPYSYTLRFMFRMEMKVHGSSASSSKTPC